jgi:hypothetical protein
VQIPTKVLMSAKIQGNTFDLNRKWERTFPSLPIFHGIFIGSPEIEINISKLLFEILLWVWGGKKARDLSQLKARVLPFTSTPSERELYRPLPIFHGICTKLIFDALLWASGAETHPGTNVSKRHVQYLWLKSQVIKNYAVHCKLFMGYWYGPP